MNRNRYTFRENVYNTISNWNRAELLLNFLQAQETHYQIVVEKAFNLQEENSNLKFTRLKVPIQILTYY